MAPAGTFCWVMYSRAAQTKKISVRQNGMIIQVISIRLSRPSLPWLRSTLRPSRYLKAK